MSTARDRILGAVRVALGTVPPNVETIAAESAELLRDPALIRPKLPGLSPAQIFAERVAREKIGATVERIAAVSALPDAVCRYLGTHALARSVALQPWAELLALNWGGLHTHRGIAPDEPAAVGFAEWGVAETGSLVFRSGPETPVLFHFLPLHHIVALRVSRIVAYLEDLAEILDAAGPAPRNLNIITGASGTTDIEGSYVRGAHGPGFLHVILVGDGE